MRPGLGPTAVLGLAGSGLAAVASSQVWGRAEVTTVAVRSLEVRGPDVAPTALPLALVALAAWGAVLVLRRRGRRVVSVVGALAAAGVLTAVALRVGDVAAAARQLSPVGDTAGLAVEATAWPWVALAGAALGLGAFVVAWLRAPYWPEMSSRYDAPAASRGDGPGPAGREASATELWTELDEGRDPTT